jgi:hypothetical protein
MAGDKIIMTDIPEKKSSEALTQETLPFFTEAEVKELNEYLASGKAKNIAPVQAANFYSLFAEGRTMTQIFKTFPEWPRGAILYARYFYKWDEQLRTHFMELVSKVKERLGTCRADIANHLMDKLTIASKSFAKDMEIYLRNPVEENLPKDRITSTHELKETIAALKEIMLFQMPDPHAGAGGQTGVTVNINTSGDKETKVIITPNDQINILDKLLEEKNKPKQ